MSGVAAVTGSTGFIGWHLSSRLVREGWSVRAIARPKSDKPVAPGCCRIRLALRRPALRSVLEGCDVVFNVAGRTRASNLKSYLAVNAEVAAQVGLAARDAGVRMIHVSSQAAGGPGDAANPRKEGDPAQPVCAYGASKLAGEDRLRSIEGLRLTILRPSAVYGPRDRDLRVLFRLAAHGVFPLVGEPERAYSFIYVEDLVRAFESVARSQDAIGETFFVNHPEAVTHEQLLRCLAAAVARRYKPVRVPTTGLWLASRLGQLGWLVGRSPVLTRSRFEQLVAGSFVCSATRIRSRTGFCASTCLEEGFRRSREWYCGSLNASH